MIDWKTKLTNKNFWIAVTGVVGATLVAFNYNQLTIDKVTAVISAYAALIAAIFAKESVDAAKDVAKIVKEYKDLKK